MKTPTAQDYNLLVTRMRTTEDWLLLAIFAGLWIFVAFLFLFCRMKRHRDVKADLDSKLPNLKSASATAGAAVEGKTRDLAAKKGTAGEAAAATALEDAKKALANAEGEENAAQENLRKAYSLVGVAWVAVLLGLAVLLVAVFHEFGSMWNLAVDACAWILSARSHFFIILAWLLPAIYLVFVLRFSPESAEPNETARTRYVDAVKTLITASGLTIAIVVATSLKPDHPTPLWIETVRRSVLCFAVCITCSVITLFVLSFLYDRADKREVRSGELFPAVLFAWIALATFFWGFIDLVRLTYLLPLNH